MTEQEKDFSSLLKEHAQRKSTSYNERRDRDRDTRERDRRDDRDRRDRDRRDRDRDRSDRGDRGDRKRPRSDQHGGSPSTSSSIPRKQPRVYYDQPVHRHSDRRYDRHDSYRHHHRRDARDDHLYRRDGRDGRSHARGDREGWKDRGDSGGETFKAIETKVTHQFVLDTSHNTFRDEPDGDESLIFPPNHTLVSQALPPVSKSAAKHSYYLPPPPKQCSHSRHRTRRFARRLWPAP